MFLIDIPFKGCQGHSIVHAVSMIPHAPVYPVSMTPHAPVASGVNDTACIVHVVSMAPHAF
jgi:hypothetical protein